MKSAHQAIAQVQENVRNYAWVLDMDIKSFFDEVDHELLMKALERHVEEKWVKMYIKRWLESPVQSKDGQLIEKQGKGTPQGGVISPLLSNLYLHYVLDKWFELKFPKANFVRYADDVIVHCSSEAEAKEMLEAIKQRLQECKLRLNEAKTQIVYCKDYRRKEKKDYGNKFDFLGFSFCPRLHPSKREQGSTFLIFGCEMSSKVRSRISAEWCKRKWHRQSNLSIQDIANQINSQMRGLIQYFCQVSVSQKGLYKLIRALHFRIMKWVINKYKRFGRSYSRAFDWLRDIQNQYPNLSDHWSKFRWIQFVWQEPYEARVSRTVL